MPEMGSNTHLDSNNETAGRSSLRLGEEVLLAVLAQEWVCRAMRCLRHESSGMSANGVCLRPEIDKT